MRKYGRVLIAAVAVVVAVGVGAVYRSLAREQALLAEKAAAKDEEKDEEKKDDAAMAAVRKTADAFAAAFNKGDAKAMAAFWTKDGEYVGPDGETVRGRAAIEKDYAEFFKKNPKATIEVHIDSVRILGRHTALEEGTLRLRLAGEKEPGESRYSVLHVRDEDGWHMASVKEWIPDPAELVSLKDVEWMLGEWVAKNDKTEARVRYTWDEDKAFLRGRFTLKRDGKVISSGTHLIGKNPAGGLRAWVFERNGSFGESVWTRDENRWVIEASATLPDSSEATAVNVLIPLDKNSFTWQTVERTVAGSELAGTPPVKVTRVKSEK